MLCKPRINSFPLFFKCKFVESFKRAKTLCLGKQINLLARQIVSIQHTACLKGNIGDAKIYGSLLAPSEKIL